MVRPILEKATGLTAGIGFSLAFSPERIDPGNAYFGFRNTPKVVGGVTPSCADAAERFYGQICDHVVRAKSAREAEMAKLLENTYRHVNIALVNEMAVFCRELGVDLWDSIRCASTKPFGYQAFYPGPGVGGHCIPIDPNYLSYKVRTLGYPFRFVELAQEINGRMPGYVTDRAADLLNRHAKPVNGARILLLGVTYKKDIADQRESPARPLARKLRARGADVSYHDPYVTQWLVDGRDIPRAASLVTLFARLPILLQAHTGYDLADIAAKSRLPFDTHDHPHDHWHYHAGSRLHQASESQHEDHQNQIGYMPEERGLYKKLTVRNQLEYLGALKGLDSHALKTAIDYWLDRFEIRSWEKKKTSDLSKGMQQKVQFILTLLHDPALLVLDEPLSGQPIRGTLNERRSDLSNFAVAAR